MEKTFENFIVDVWNQFAYEISMAVAEAPGEAYNPLIIFGGTGYGKTHLACAIKHKVETELGMRVLMRECHEILDEWVVQMKVACSKDKKPNLYEWFEGYDVIILENIQCLACKSATQEYFADAFCQLAMERKQVVLTTSIRMGDKSMKDLYNYMNRRCGYWLLADMLAPEMSTKRRFLDELLDGSGWKLEESVKKIIVQRCVNRCQIEAVLGELGLFCVLYDCEPNEEVVHFVLQKRNL